jgi:hypothetical protein
MKMSRKVLIINTGGTLSPAAREYGLRPDLTTESMYIKGRKFRKV